MKYFTSNQIGQWILFWGILIGSLVNSSRIYGQQLKVESLIEDPTDISARTNQILDANKKPCALLKIKSMDEISNIEGNVITIREIGLEYWVYICEGTKLLKIHTLRHPALELNLSKYLHEGAKGNMVYKLDLKSDLSPELLFGFSKAFEPVTMEAKGNPLLPDWWNTQEDDHYVGISLPSYDGEAAKYSAMLNAISLYAAKQGMSVQSRGVNDFTKTNETIIQKNTYNLRAYIDHFSVRVLQEYYNHEGTYFLLCRITHDNNSSNMYIKDWAYEDGEYKEKDTYLSKDGEINDWTYIKLSIKRQPIKLISHYKCKWNEEDVCYTDSINNIALLKSMYKIKDCHNDYMMQSNEPIGFLQTKYLSSLPVLTDSVRVKGREVTIAEEDMDEPTTYAAFEILGNGRSRGQIFKLVSENGENFKMSVTEQFPTDPYKMDNINGYDSEFDDIGISMAYSKEFDLPFYKGTGIYEFPLWEVVKNNGLIKAITSSVSRFRYPSNEDLEDPKFVKLYEADKRLSTRDEQIPIYPLWYMDAQLRTNKYKKGLKDKWKTVNNELNNGVGIIIPLN